MLWTVTDKKILKEQKRDAEGGCRLCGRRAVLPTVAVLVLLAIAGYFLLRTPSEEQHVVIKFDDKFKEVCASPKLAMPQYEGVGSFFKYLQAPDAEYCYSWIEFGGEKLPVSAQTEEQCNDEVRKAKFICFNEEYKMNLDPCLVYSFGKDLDSQFERDMHLFSCETHAFDPDEVTIGEHVKRTEFWYEHNWEIAEFPYDLPANENPKNSDQGGAPRLRRSLDFITTMLGHVGREIKYLKSDLQGREWMLLRQIVTYQDMVDIRQVGLRIHLPTKTRAMTAEERHATYEKLFQVLQGLTCSGYRFVLARPIKYYKGAIYVPELNNTYFPAYEVNFVKDLSV